VEYKKNEYEVLSIHAHSKELLGPPDISDDRWRQIMNEANLEVSREIKVKEFNDSYNGVPKLVDRIRIARKNGYFKHLQKYVLRKLEKIMRKPT
jgi:hypothetical protein